MLGSLPQELGYAAGTRMGWGWPGGVLQPCGRKGTSQVPLCQVPQDRCDTSARRCAGPWLQNQERFDNSAGHTDFTDGAACEQLLSATQCSCRPLCEGLLLWAWTDGCPCAVIPTPLFTGGTGLFPSSGILSWVGGGRPSPVLSTTLIH